MVRCPAFESGEILALACAALTALSSAEGRCYSFALNPITGVSAHATVRVVVLTPECNEVGKHVWRRARATVPALGLHRPLPGPRRANTNSCSRSPLYSREGCVCSAVLTRVRVRHPLCTYESS